MAREFHVYPKAYYVDSTLFELYSWQLVIKVGEFGGDPAAIRSEYSFPAVSDFRTVTDLISMPKIVFDVVTPDMTTPEDIEAAIVVDTVRISGRIDTPWGHFQTRAESVITGLTDPTERDVRNAWRAQDVAHLQRVARTMVESHGWSITRIRGE